MTINERLKILIEALGMNPSSFSERVKVNDGTTRSYLNRGSKPSSDYLEAVIRAIVELNERWLLTGEGEMFKKSEAGANISGNRITGSHNATGIGTSTTATGPADLELMKCQMENEHLRQRLKDQAELLELYKRHSSL